MNSISTHESFNDSLKSLNIEDKKLKQVLDIVDKKYHQNLTEENSEPIPGMVKVIINMMRLATGKKLNNFSNEFLVKVMDVDLTKPQFYAVLENIDKHYNNVNGLNNSPKIK